MHPRLWSPAHPQLYRMRSYYTTEDSGRYLADEQYTGIRTVRFDAEHGFYLNGTRMKIKGVCVHHPSVILWSIGNEIDYPNDPYCHPDFLTMTGNNDANKPAAERQYDPYKPNAERMVVLARELSRIVREEDESRPVTMALAYPELSAKLGIFSALDVAGYNYKEHLYEQDHSRYKNVPFLGSENGHSYAAWQAVAANDYISGQFLWTGIDFLGEAAGWPVHDSAAGMLDLAGFEKAEYYRRASFWKEEPVLALAIVPEKEADRTPGVPSWNYSPGETVCVACYTNLPRLSLFLNGKEAGGDVYEKDGAYYFKADFEPGSLWQRVMMKAAGCAARQCFQLPAGRKLFGEKRHEKKTKLY